VNNVDIVDIEYLLACLDLSNFKAASDANLNKYKEIKASHFKDAEPIDLWAEIYDSEISKRLNMQYFAMATPEMCRSRIDYKFLKQHTKHNTNECIIELCRVREVHPKEFYRFAKPIGRNFFEISNAWVNAASFEATTSRSYFGWVPKINSKGEVEGSRILNLTLNSVFDGSLDDLRWRITMAIAKTLTSEYCWSVSLGWDDKLMLRFPTDALGVKEVFRLRSIPNGESRKKALLHWVSEHYRRTKKYDEPIDIQPYLRGNVKFNWNGLLCVIKPSIDDVLGLKNKNRINELL
jgi:hypothetical protein